MKCEDCCHAEMCKWIDELGGRGCDFLSQEPCDVFDKYGNYKYPSDVELTEPNTATSMPCDDAISREDAEECKELMTDINGDTVYAVRMSDIRQLPSVTQKSGKWIEKDGWDGDVYYECSICGESFCLIDGTPTDNMYNYCPNCGAEMESEE